MIASDLGTEKNSVAICSRAGFFPVLRCEDGLKSRAAPFSLGSVPSSLATHRTSSSHTSVAKRCSAQQIDSSCASRVILVRGILDNPLREYLRRCF